MGKRWSEEEEEILREYYPKEGTEIADRLDGRTRQAIWLHAMRRHLNVEPEITSRNVGRHLNDGDNDYVEWTKEEKKILNEQYRSNKGKMHELLPRHTEQACRQKACNNDLSDKKPKWSDDEIKLLRDNINKDVKDLLPMFPGRTKKSIYSMKFRIREAEKQQ